MPPTARDSRLDLIRLIAFILLIGCHACDPFNAAATYGSGIPNPEFTRWGAVWGAVVRPCVPLFVMLTGALLLGRTSHVESGFPSQGIAMGSFYRKRIPRVLWPFLIWGAAYYLFPWLLGILGYGPEVVSLFFPWAETTSQSLSTALGRLVRLPYHFSYVACHLWYIYMLVGLYLYLPVFDAWVERSSVRQQRGFLLLWSASTFLPYLSEFGTPYHFGTCDWNQFGLFYYFAGFSGYLLLGHHLYRHVPMSLPLSLAVAVPLFSIGYVVNLWGYRHILSLPAPTPQQVELFWTYCTPNVLLMSAALFLVLLRLPVRRPLSVRLLSSLTCCGFGIFMVHYFFVGPTFRWVEGWCSPVSLRIPLAALFIFVESWSVVALLRALLGKRVGRIVFG